MPMPPIFLSPIVKWTLVAIGGAIVVHWVVSEIKRVNEELEARRARVRIRDQEDRPTLRRDPESGEYRL
jgi:hypothetical protein